MESKQSDGLHFCPEQGVTVDDQPDRGNFLTTFMDHRFYPFDPRPEEMCIEDIAHSLAFKCRFNGFTPKFYSVAEHSVILSNIVSEPVRRAALMHDGSEAYIPDIPRPLKVMMQEIIALEQPILDVVFEKFGLEPGLPEEVHEMDTIMPAMEAVRMWDPAPTWCQYYGELPIIKLYNWSPEEAEYRFLRRFHELFPEYEA